MRKMIFTAFYLVATLAAAASAETLLRNFGGDADASFIMGSAAAKSLAAVHRFADTGNGTQSRYALGANPYAELLQASDGNFYGTTPHGGSGACTNAGDSNDVVGCGTIFRMTPTGTVTALYSFPYDSATHTAASGAYPVAGLIQGRDGYLYGVANDGGMAGECNAQLGCGTMFRISLAGVFKLLHQFCVGTGCPSTEGGQPMAHLVQRSDTSLCGTTAEGGFENEGTVFCASLSGAVDTLYDFHYENGTDGYDPLAALLVGPDGETLYGTTVSRGANGGGTVFAIGSGGMTILHAFDSNESTAPDACFYPEGALIFGADGRLYGTTYASGNSYGCIFSLNTDGSSYAVNYAFPAGSNFPVAPVAGLVLARNGLMYGTTLSGSIVGAYGGEGTAFSFDPATGKFTGLADCGTATGAAPRAAFIEGADKFLYSTASLYGGSNKRGTDAGTVFRLVPALKQ